VQFVISAPEARTVALAGDFNEWDPSIQLDDVDGDGFWSGRVALEPGRAGCNPGQRDVGLG